MGVDTVGARRKAVFLDRDGVLNRAIVRDGRPFPPASPQEVLIPPGTAEALERLHAGGYLLIVVTNQPDVARGRQTREGVEAINAVLAGRLPLDDIRVCYHDDGDDCACRKPRPGLLLQAAGEHGIDLAASYMIGDRSKDIEAGERAGTTTVFIDYRYREEAPGRPGATASSLREAVDWILSRDRSSPMAHDFKVKVFADGADKKGMLEMYERPYIKGFTTNPTLMRRAGITDYEAFARDILEAIPDRPISFEVFSDEFDEMERQALKIAGWGNEVYVKIPVTNTRREPSYQLIERLSAKGVKLNITALMTLEQVRDVVASLAGGVSSYVSVFAGRIADTGRDPLPLMAAAVELLKLKPRAELIWASPRELLNILHAESIGCHIITVTNDILKKLEILGRDLSEYSLDTVKMFYNDAHAAGFEL